VPLVVTLDAAHGKPILTKNGICRASKVTHLSSFKKIQKPQTHFIILHNSGLISGSENMAKEITKNCCFRSVHVTSFFDAFPARTP